MIKTKRGLIAVLIAVIWAVTAMLFLIPQVSVSAEKVGDFEVTGGTKGEDYTYENNVLTVLKETKITIKNVDPSVSTTDRIVVESDVSANITLAGVNIDVSGIDKTPAFKIADDSTRNVTIILVGDNTLKSGSSCAGLQKNDTGTLTITGEGSLSATGGSWGAGIGGGDNGSGSNIIISGGTIYAKGGSSGAGIGGGCKGSGEHITISGGTVNATSDTVGAGIGGGNGGSGSDITISGGTIYATGGYRGAGIGGGPYGSGSDIKISGGTVTATGGNSGAGIGGGYEGNGSNITISDGTITATSPMYGAGIGGGNKGNGSDIKISGGTVTATGCKNGAGIGGGKSGSGSDIKISGGSVKAVGNYNNNIGCTPTLADGTTPVYLLEIANPDSKDVTIDGKAYTPVNHKAADSSDTNLYVYLSAAPHTVKVGNKKAVTYNFSTAKNKFLLSPADDDFVFTPPTDDIYDGTAKTAVVTVKDGIVGMGEITEVLHYNESGQKIDQPVDAGTYTVKITVAEGDNYTATDSELEVGSFTIRKAIPTVAKPTATAITFGETLAASTLTTGWSWTDDTAKPDVQNSGYEAYTTVTDDNNYDYSNLDGYTYDEASHKLTTKVQVTVNKAVPTITEPTSTAITYGQKLSDSVLSDTNWSWVSEDTVPDVNNRGYEAVITVDDSNYDYTGISGYDSTAHTVTRTVAVTVNKADVTADMLEFTAPANTVYDGHNKTAAVTAKTGLTGIGRITIRYYVNGTEVNDTSLPNTYTVKIDAAGGANFNSASDITDTSWTFTVTAAEQLMPLCNLTFTLESDGTYTAKIGFVAGAEYKFNDGSWSDDNTLSGLSHGTSVTAHIRMKATATHNASTEASDTKATGHGILEHHEAVPATCVDDGTIEYWSDAVCGKLFSDADGITEITDIVQPATGHSWSEWKINDSEHWKECINGCGEISERAPHNPGPAATEDDPQICTDCGYEIAPATGHIHTNHLVLVPAVPESCFTDGNTAYYECSCGKYFSDDQALNEITAEDFTIAAHHTVDPLAVWESDNDDNHYHICSACGGKADISAHNYDDGIIITEPTETSEGEKLQTCVDCNHEKISTLSHIHVLESTYTSDSIAHWFSCYNCDEKVNYEIHVSDGGTVTTEPTETTTGVKTFRCATCGYVMKTETIPVKEAPSYPTYPSNPTYPTIPTYPTTPTIPTNPTSTTTPANTPSSSSTNIVTPKLTVKTEIHGKTATISWNKITNADSYIIYQLIDGKYVKVKTTTDTSVTFKNLTNGETYKFMVKYNMNGRTYSTGAAGKFTVKVYYKPIAKATAGRNRIKLSWAEVPNAEKYAIYKYVDGKAVKLTETTKLSVIIKGLKPDTEYKYIVRAYVDGKWTDMKISDIVTVKTKA